MKNCKGEKEIRGLIARWAKLSVAAGRESRNRGGGGQKKRRVGVCHRSVKGSKVSL